MLQKMDSDYVDADRAILRWCVAAEPVRGLYRPLQTSCLILQQYDTSLHLKLNIVTGLVPVR